MEPTKQTPEPAHYQPGLPTPPSPNNLPAANMPPIKSERTAASKIVSVFLYILFGIVLIFAIIVFIAIILRYTP